ncbi:MAG TPA: hypothetical protein VFH73_24375 [Polyangia bacterium]|nr:hypothetical protein [Polyangia bacterium]
MAGRFLALFLLAQVSCITATSTTVRVRDLRKLDLTNRDNGQVVIASGADVATVPLQKGAIWNWFEKMPFEVDAIREPTGTLRLQCDACGGAPWPKIGREAASLVQANGDLVPSVGHATISPAAITLPYQTCFVASGSKHHHCEIESRTSVTIPWENVVEADRSTSPVRFWGVALVTFGAAEIAGGAIALSPAFGDANYALSSRATFALPLITTGAVALGVGLWHLLAPTRAEHIFPLGQTPASTN